MRRSILAVLFSSLLLGSCSSRAMIVDRKPHASPPHGPASSVAVLKVPPGHFPPPEMFRVWIPGRSPGHQPPPTSCRSVHGDVPAGAWVLHRPSKKKKLIEVTAYHGADPDVVLWVRYFDSKTGAFVSNGT